MAQLREHGVALLRGAFAKPSLIQLREAAARCFDAIAQGATLPERYQFNRSAHSILLNALLDFDCDHVEALTAPLSIPGLGPLFSDAMSSDWTCNMEQSWVRKKFAPSHTPDTRYHIQDWHQDGALGVRFPLQPGPAVQMTSLLTCWIPLNACGVDSPGLEFIRRHQPALLHFTELNDAALRARFSPQDFLAPQLELGDGLVFCNDILHRTFVHDEMHQNRISVEYRIFPL